MKTVHIQASKEYDVLIKHGLINEIGEHIKKLTKSSRVALVAGEKVFSIYGENVLNSLYDNGFDVITFTHKTGEGAKSLEVYGKLVNFLCNKHISRSDMLIALGGGVTGDLTGFAAATYLRGIPYVQIPTTLLAGVDSSVGGKTAINLENAKNQIGCFYQPAAVFCDPDTFKTLSYEDYRSGCAEIIKYALMGDSSLFDFLENNVIRKNEEKVVARCIEIKRDTVKADEFDKGERQKLNLGHTFGHAIEKCSNFTIRHGDAVAIGLAIVLRAAVKKGFCSEEVYNRTLKLYNKFGLPAFTNYSSEQLYFAAMSDKKITENKINLIVPEDIGTCEIINMNTENMKNWLTDGNIKES